MRIITVIEITHMYLHFNKCQSQNLLSKFLQVLLLDFLLKGIIMDDANSYPDEINADIKFILIEGMIANILNLSGWYIVSNKIKKGPFATRDLAVNVFFNDRKQL